MQNLSLDLRTRFGGDTLERVIAEDVLNDPHDIVIVDGIRRMDDIAKFKTFPNFYLISIEAGIETRYTRSVRRNENAGDSEKTQEQFIAEDQREAEREIPKVMATAKYTVNNDEDFPALYGQLDKIIAEIKNINL